MRTQRVPVYHAFVVSVVMVLVVSACQAGGPGGTTPGASEPGPMATGGGSQSPQPPAFEPGDVEVVVHSGPGSGNDTLARSAMKIAAEEGLIESAWPVRNEEGGSGAAAMSYMGENAGDPNKIAFHTFVWVTTPIRLGESAIDFDDLTPIARLVSESSLIVVAANSPYQTLQDLLDADGPINQAGGSVGSLEHVNSLLLQDAAGVEWNWVSFESQGERTAALLGGHVDLQSDGARDFVELARSGEVRVLATVAEKRNPLFPDVPTVAEATGLDLDFVVERRGVIGTPDMPEEAVAYYEDLLRRLVETDAWKQYEVDSGFVPDFADHEEWFRNLDEGRTILKPILTKLGLVEG